MKQVNNNDMFPKTPISKILIKKVNKLKMLKNLNLGHK